VAAFHRIYEAVEKPSTILRQAAAGTLTPDTVAAVRQAHPQYFADMQSAILSKLATYKAPIPYMQRQMLSLIMGRDMDGTPTPDMLQAVQSSFVLPEQHQPGMKPTSKGLEKLHLSTRLQTPAQASANRGNGGE
jgi:hypothetical protein